MKRIALIFILYVWSFPFVRKFYFSVQNFYQLDSLIFAALFLPVTAGSVFRKFAPTKSIATKACDIIILAVYSPCKIYDIRCLCNTDRKIVYPSAKFTRPFYRCIFIGFSVIAPTKLIQLRLHCVHISTIYSGTVYIGFNRNFFAIHITSIYAGAYFCKDAANRKPRIRFPFCDKYSFKKCPELT